ncbi:MAG: SDR family NAD(P)-dependent oxidoreductase [Bdellovibrionales bacterium]|nr:SDR family NAD(P)-dependent oxidoreductase [Bdellovibrionales bacterium]
MKIKNKTILITGGSSGIGLEFAKQLYQQENKVIITGKNSEKLERIKKDYPHLKTIKSDVSQSNEIASLFQYIVKHYSDLSILINNAGIGKKIDLTQSHNVNLLNEEILVNLYGPIVMVNQFLPLLLKLPEAAIINITSALAFSPYPAVPIYSATKAGLQSYTSSLRMQLRNTSVKVFEIAPPSTQTEMLNGFGSRELKNINIMSPQKLVKISLEKIEQNQEQICPGQTAQLKYMSRIAPQFVLRQMSRHL